MYCLTPHVRNTMNGIVSCTCTQIKHTYLVIETHNADSSLRIVSICSAPCIGKYAVVYNVVECYYCLGPSMCLLEGCSWWTVSTGEVCLYRVQCSHITNGPYIACDSLADWSLNCIGH